MFEKMILTPYKPTREIPIKVADTQKIVKKKRNTIPLKVKSKKWIKIK
jgi:hypothetical protein